MTENEFKIMLTKEQYEKLLGMYGFKTFTQTNHYYDTADLSMSARHITVRVRELEGGYFLQMKLPTETAFSRKELSKELSGIPGEISGAELGALAGGEFPDVKRLGALTTVRSVWEFGGGEIDLDKSSYFSKTDYELEIEFTNEQAARRVLDELRQKLGFADNGEVCMGKVRRFLEEYRKS